MSTTLVQYESFDAFSPANDRYQSPRLPEMEIQLADFWREVDERLPRQ